MVGGDVIAATHEAVVTRLLASTQAAALVVVVVCHVVAEESAEEESPLNNSVGRAGTVVLVVHEADVCHCELDQNHQQCSPR